MRLRIYEMFLAAILLFADPNTAIVLFFIDAAVWYFTVDNRIFKTLIYIGISFLIPAWIVVTVWLIEMAWWYCNLDAKAIKSNGF